MQRLNFLAPIAQALRASSAPIIVTGAGGWLGHAVIEMLCSALGDAFPARVTAYAASPRVMLLRSGRQIPVRGLADLAQAQSRPALIFHFAFLTRGHVQQDDYVAINRAITRVMRDFIERAGAAGLFVPSSGAVYGPGRMLDEDMARNPYGVLKHADEVIFGSLAREFGFPVVITRIFNLAGPFINNLNAYALACIITDIKRGGPIKLRADHPVFRSYTHVADVLSIAAGLLLGGHETSVFDTAGEEALEIGALAARAARVLTGMDMPVIRPDWQNGPENRYIGDFAGYINAALLAGVTLQPLDRQIADTAAYLDQLGA